MRAAVVVALALALAGCAGARRDDARLRVTAPSAGSSHGLPLTVRWTPVRGAVAYVVFVDRPPVAPGEPTPRPAIDVLASSGTSVELSRLAGQAASERRDHHLVVIAVGPSGRRIGERAGLVDVTIDPLVTDQPTGAR